MQAEASLAVILVVMLLADLIIREPGHRKLQILGCILMAVQLALNVVPAEGEAFGGMYRSTELASVVTHVADLRTCCLHPASTTHRQMTDEQLKEAGVAPDLIRLSVGIENIDDILADLDQALTKATK